jgi:hypothetical protein
MRSHRSSRAESRAARSVSLVVVLLSACASPLSDVTISPLDFGAVEPALKRGARRGYGVLCLLVAGEVCR